MRIPPTARPSSRRRAGADPNLWFNQVPEPKTAKNRVHFDLRAPGPMDDEVARLAVLGAVVLHRFPHSVMMADPEGNEFCVEPGPV
jgi:Glyoxalase-like domain